MNLLLNYDGSTTFKIFSMQFGPKNSHWVQQGGTKLSFHSDSFDDEYEHTDIIRKQMTSHSGSPDKMAFNRQPSIQD